MKEEFILYEEAIALKELGFIDQCFGWYCMNKKQLYPISPLGKNFDDTALAPLYQQAFRWLLENKMNKEDFIIERNPSNLDLWDAQVFCKQSRTGRLGWGYESQQVSYQEAQDSCLKKLIEICQEKTK